MNLYYLTAINWSQKVQLGKSFQHLSKKIGKKKHKGFELIKNDQSGSSHLFCRIRDIQEFPEFDDGNNHSGFFVYSPIESRCLVHSVITENNSGSKLASTKQKTGRAPLEIIFPTMADNVGQTLSIYVEPYQTGKLSDELFISNFVSLERRRLYPFLQGNGLEIGPGHQPFLQSESVTYLEKHPRDEWDAANTQISIKDHEKWDKYIIGEANNIPLPDESLDFIFASHVFEHLVNPVGHIEHWLTKLKAGGHIVCIVPMTDGSRDFRATPTDLSRILAAYEEGTFEHAYEHYKYFHDIHLMDESVESMIEGDYSIHVTFYNKNSVLALLRHIVNQFSLSGFWLWHENNHKDFFFALKK
jgi:SAM-dependent methyltransferase